MRSFHRRHGIIRWTAFTVTLALALVCVRPRPAKAELTIATVTAVVGLVGAVGEALGKWKALFGDSGPAIASQLNGVKVAIINELRTQRNQQWRANVQTVFDNFAILGARPKNDPDNEPLRASTLETSKFAFNQYAIIVEDGNDSGSSYQLAPMFSVLTGVHAGLTKMKGELKPSAPARWVEFDIYFKRSMQASNRLVGTMVSGCWPGFNPGKGKYVVANQPGLLNAGRAPATQIKSQLWNRLAAGYITVPFSSNSSVKSACTSTLVVGGIPLPIETGICKSTSGSVRCLGYTLGTASPVCLCENFTSIGPTTSCGKAAISAAVAIGSNTSTGVFGSNNVVKIVRANMNAILAVGGGDDRFDNSTVPVSGALTDPWLDEPNCGPFGPWSYPSVP